MASADAPVPGPTPAVAGRRRSGASPLLAATGVLVGLVFAAPLVYLAVRTLTGAGGPAALVDVPSLRPAANSLALAATVAASTAVLGTAAAWLTHRTDLPGRRLWRVLLPLPLVIPSFIGAFALIAAFTTGGLVEQLLAPLGVDALPRVRGFWAAYGVETALTYPYVYLPVAARLAQLPPSLEETARLFGRRPREAFTSVVLPQLRGSILAGTLLVFLYTLSEFGAVQLMQVETLTTRIFALKLAAPTTALALSLQLGILALLVVVIERAASGGPEARQRDRAVRGLAVDLARWRPAATAFVGGLVGLGLLAPVGVMAFWAVRGVLRGASRAGALVTDLGALVGPALNTAQVSVAAALVAVVVVLPVARLTARYRARASGVANALVLVGFALPGLAIALAVTFWSRQLPVLDDLGGGYVLLIGAYVVHFGAQALRTAEVAVASIPTRLDDAARSLGAGWWTRLRTVELPLMAPGLAAGAGLVLLSTMKELEMTLLVAPAGFETLATQVWGDASEGFFADAGLGALLLVALSGVLTWVLVVRRAQAV